MSDGDEADLGSQSEGSGSSAEDDCSPDSPEVDQDFQANVRSALGPAALELDSVSYVTPNHCCFTDLRT